MLFNLQSTLYLTFKYIVFFTVIELRVSPGAGAGPSAETPHLHHAPHHHHMVITRSFLTYMKLLLSF